MAISTVFQEKNDAYKMKKKVILKCDELQNLI